MKLSEYAKDLLVMVELYGDHDVVERDDYSLEFVEHARSPRLCCVGTTSGGRNMAFPKTNAAAHATKCRAELTGRYVYAI